MNPNPIDEIKQIRHRLGAAAGFDVGRIFAELRQQQSTSNRRYVDTSDSDIASINAINRSGEAGRSAS